MKTETHHSTHLGMWLFLAGEVLLFGALLLAFELAHAKFPAEFRLASGKLHFYHGTINTFLLLTSSYLVALSQASKNRLLVFVSALIGVIFLGIKGSEYWDLYQEGLLLSRSLFFTFYFFITFLHALHVSVGIVLLLVVGLRMKKNDVPALHENVGLYWHFVDLVWVFVFPLFYLLGH